MLQNKRKISKTGLRKYKQRGFNVTPGNDRFSEWRHKELHIASATSEQHAVKSNDIMKEFFMTELDIINSKR
jgi:hypothetical protein